MELIITQKEKIKLQNCFNSFQNHYKQVGVDSSDNCIRQQMQHDGETNKQPDYTRKPGMLEPGECEH